MRSPNLSSSSSLKTCSTGFLTGAVAAAGYAAAPTAADASKTAPKLLQRRGGKVVTLDALGLDLLTPPAPGGACGSPNARSKPTCTPTSSAAGTITGSSPTKRDRRQQWGAPPPLPQRSGAVSGAGDASQRSPVANMVANQKTEHSMLRTSPVSNSEHSVLRTSGVSSSEPSMLRTSPVSNSEQSMLRTSPVSNAEPSMLRTSPVSNSGKVVPASGLTSPSKSSSRTTTFFQLHSQEHRRVRAAESDGQQAYGAIRHGR